MKVIVVGFGVVGRALTRLIQTRVRDLNRNHDMNLKIIAIADSKSLAIDRAGLKLGRILSLKETKDVVGPGTAEDTLSIIEESDADVVVELTPTDPRTGEPGLEYMTAALKSGKSVVTANKGPLVTAYPNLRKLADKNGVQLKYSAAVGGGNPVLAFGEICASSEPVTKVEAILNRTSNYILTQMEEKGIAFETALRDARRIGLAEPDPSLDVDGLDQACKIVIVANHVMKRTSYITDVNPIQSIRDVTPERIAKARRRGKKIRMVGVADKTLEVRLVELDERDPFAIRGSADVTRFHCAFSGAKMVTSSVGGPSYTAAGLLRDLVEVQSSTR